MKYKDDCEYALLVNTSKVPYANSTYHLRPNEAVVIDKAHAMAILAANPGMLGVADVTEELRWQVKPHEVVPFESLDFSYLNKKLEVQVNDKSNIEESPEETKNAEESTEELEESTEGEESEEVVTPKRRGRKKVE